MSISFQNTLTETPREMFDQISGDYGPATFVHIHHHTPTLKRRKVLMGVLESETFKDAVTETLPTRHPRLPHHLPSPLGGQNLLFPVKGVSISLSPLCLGGQGLAMLASGVARLELPESACEAQK